MADGIEPAEAGLTIDPNQLIERMADALSEAVDFFAARDEMNAKVHLSDPRWSPITDLCRDALEMWRAYRYPALIDGSISGAGSGSQDPSDEAQQRPLRGSMPPPAPEHNDGDPRG